MDRCSVDRCRMVDMTVVAVAVVVIVVGVLWMAAVADTGEKEPTFTQVMEALGRAVRKRQ